MRLQNKVAVITGAGTRIGEAIAQKFAREGARLVLSGLPADPVQDVADAITNAGGRAVVHLGDLAEELHAQACVELALQSFGSLDIPVSTAGIFIANAATDDYRIEDFERTGRNNIRTAFLMTKFSLPHLRASRGNIVFTGSEAGLNGSPRFTPLWRKQGLPSCLHEGRCLGAGAVRRTRQWRLPGSCRYGVDPKRRQSDRPGRAIGNRRHGSSWSAGNAGRDGQHLRVSRVRRSELRDWRAVAGRWRCYAGQK